MPALKLDQVLVACPHCGHRQPEARSAFSTICRECGHHLRVQEILHPPSKPLEHAPAQRQVTCFECGAGLDVPLTAESTMCKWCSRYVDLHDYRITTAVAKNFKTKGNLVIEPRGNVFNSETVAGDITIKGKFHGKLIAERSLTLHAGAEIKGSLLISHLVIPSECQFNFPAPLRTVSAEIAGEFSGTLTALAQVRLTPTARWFGDLCAAEIVVEAGAVVVGRLHIQSPTAVSTLSPA